ncbi:MAG: EthD domain-containing protein [Gammaproteobacteria bacterium]|nr:EthD domain-containing protein [Gammaproteobacteria bacterium]MBT4494865.1 EthD domain-containing protein [Gammaproteobacteria bacterium]MBT7370935.1 EthD domain-containing protein [Gammaproteobacteria bacterium]
MIRLVFALRRKPDMNRAEFQDYWLRQHAPLVAGFATDLDILRYVQTHTLDDPANKAAQAARGDMEPEYDGVAELWWASEKDLTENLQSKAARAAGAALLEDEQKFIDLPNSPLWFAYEYPQINPCPENVIANVKSNIVRVFFPLRHQESVSEDDARHYWLTHHGPIVRSHGHAAGTLCYRQVHRANSPLDEGVQAPRGTKVASYLGHAEAWIDFGSIRNTHEAKRANAAFIEDERNFIDLNRSTIFYGKEHSIIDRRYS